MNYLLVTNNEYIIKKNISKLFKEHKLSEDMLTTYDLTIQTLDDILEDLDTYSFLTPKKLIVSRSSNFLNSEKLEEKTEKHLFKYLSNPNEDHILLIITDKLDERKKVVKEVKKQTKLLSAEVNQKDLIKEKLNDYKIDNKASELLLEYCHNDIGKLIQECEKLELYKLDTKEINEDDIRRIVVKKINDDDDYIFELMTNIISKNKAKALKIYADLKTLGVEPLAIIGLMANQFHFLLQVAILDEKNYRQDEIASTLKAHPYRVKISLGNIRNYPKENLIQSIKSLATIDLNVKKGTTQIDYAIENFIVSL